VPVVFAIHTHGLEEKLKPARYQPKAEFFVWKYRVTYFQNYIDCWSSDNLYFQFLCMLSGHYMSTTVFIKMLLKL